MQVSTYHRLKKDIAAAGYREDITWAENITPPKNALYFADEIIFVICNSGMKAQVARPIYEKVTAELYDGRDPSKVFRHQGKVAAINYVFENRFRLFREYLATADKLAYLETLPYIGKITKYHAAKNFGLPVVKPDRHLVRIAADYKTLPYLLCKQLSEETGDSVAVVDTVIWRAANLGWL